MSDWIEWSGGDCPIPNDETIFNIRFRSTGDEVDIPLRGGSDFRWNHTEGAREVDIIAYRVVS